MDRPDRAGHIILAGVSAGLWVAGWVDADPRRMTDFGLAPVHSSDGVAGLGCVELALHWHFASASESRYSRHTSGDPRRDDSPGALHGVQDAALRMDVETRRNRGLHYFGTAAWIPALNRYRCITTGPVSSLAPQHCRNSLGRQTCWVSRPGPLGDTSLRCCSRYASHFAHCATIGGESGFDLAVHDRQTGSARITSPHRPSFSFCISSSSGSCCAPSADTSRPDQLPRRPPCRGGAHSS